MESEDKRVSLKIDLRSGTIELEAPASSFDQAIEKTKELTSSLDLRRADSSASDVGKQSPDKTRRANDVAGATPSGSEKSRAKSVKSGSGARTGRLGSFTPDNDLLTEEQQRAIREFRTSKAPADMHEEALVALHQGEHLLSRQGFGFNEIYTLMWRAGTSPLPKALDEVMRQLALQQLVERNEQGYFLKFMGRERVERELPRKKE